MSDKIEVDTARVAALLEIAERCTGHSGKLANLQGWAIGELIALNAEIKDAGVAAQAEAEAKAAEEVRAAEVKIQADAMQNAKGVPETPGLEDPSVPYSPPAEAPASPPTDSTSPTLIERRV